LDTRVRLPGLRRLDRLGPGRPAPRADLLAGAPGAVAGVPDGMAAAVLAGVNPVYGLYASAFGPIAGGLAVSTRLMVVTTTSAAALAAGSALSTVPSAQRADALFLLTILAGLLAVAAGLLRLGRYVRFVSVSVMVGFLTGVAANIVFGQIPTLTGAPAEGSFALAKAVHVLASPGEIDVPSLLTGLAALALAFGLARSRLSPFAPIVALVLPTLATLGVSGIQRVDDLGAIPKGIPAPHLPGLGAFSFHVVTGAFAVAAIVLVQGAGVAEAAPNADGRPADTNRDFLAQGIGNVAAGLFRGQPVGGSVGRTSLNLAAGARTRWASIFSGLLMLAILALFSGAVGKVAMPTLAAILIFAAISSIRTDRILLVFRTGRPSQIAFTTTFLATLFLPVAAAVGIGVALSLLLQLDREALDLRVVELRMRPDGLIEERPAPGRLESESATVLDVYGSLYYAGARTLEARLPDPARAVRPVVVLRLRGRTALGATSFAVLVAYAERLEAAAGRLYLSGVDPGLLEQFRRAHPGEAGRRVRVFTAGEVVGESTRLAHAEALAWIAAHPGETPAGSAKSRAE
jgi:SulP family sulfate permease